MTGKIVLVNYANKLYSQAQKKNAESALNIGGFDRVISYSPKDIDKDFFEENMEILKQNKGNGYWLWKPYFIKKALESLNNGDFLFYCDSGSYFIDSIKNLISGTDLDQELIVFELPFLEKQYTKRDTFILMECDYEKFHNSKQILAGFSLWKKSHFTLLFIEKWLSYAKDARILTDLKNDCGFPDFDEFIDHRHDQSIFSLLSKKYDLKVYRDPSQFGNEYIDIYQNSTYDQLIVLTRKKNSLILLYRINEFLFKLGLICKKYL